MGSEGLRQGYLHTHATPFVVAPSGIPGKQENVLGLVSIVLVSSLELGMHTGTHRARPGDESSQLRGWHTGEPPSPASAVTSGEELPKPMAAVGRDEYHESYAGLFRKPRRGCPAQSYVLGGG